MTPCPGNIILIKNVKVELSLLCN